MKQKALVVQVIAVTQENPEWIKPVWQELAQETIGCIIKLICRIKASHSIITSFMDWESSFHHIRFDECAGYRANHLQPNKCLRETYGKLANNNHR